MAIQAVPIPEPTLDEAPKRGRGRARKDPNDTSPRTPRTRGVAVTEDAVGGLLFMVNIPLSMIGPLRADALDPDEITALAKGIVEQSKQSPAFRRYVQYALRASGATGVITPLAFILARRAMRHGLLPGGAEADAQLGQFIGVMAGTVAMTEMVPPPGPPTYTVEDESERVASVPPVGSPVPTQPIPAGSFDVPVD